MPIIGISLNTNTITAVLLFICLVIRLIMIYDLVMIYYIETSITGRILKTNNIHCCLIIYCFVIIVYDLLYLDAHYIYNFKDQPTYFDVILLICLVLYLYYYLILHTP